jgi:hypothetical protein
MQRIAKTTDEFIEHWGQKQNFLIAPECIGFDMDFPPVEEVCALSMTWWKANWLLA